MKVKIIEKICYFCGTNKGVRISEDCPPLSLVEKTFRNYLIPSCNDCNGGLSLLDNISVNWLKAIIGTDDEKTTRLFNKQIRGEVPKLSVGVDDDFNAFPLIHVSSYAIQAWLLKLSLGLYVHIEKNPFKGTVAVLAADFPQLLTKDKTGCRKLMTTLDYVSLQWSDVETVNNQSFSMRYTKDKSENLIIWVGFYNSISAYFCFYDKLSQKDGDYLAEHGATLWSAPYDPHLVRETVNKILKDDEGLYLNETSNIIHGFQNSKHKKLFYLNLQVLQKCAADHGMNVRDFLEMQSNK